MPQKIACPTLEPQQEDYEDPPPPK